MTFSENKSLPSLALIDFGFSKVLSSDYQQKKQAERFQGNFLFSSPSMFNLIPPSQRDDLISLVYLMIYLISPQSLPWTSLI
mmetsp:Transcript_23477/g.23140  ORF Transcript_23477/g.23140 Transcript_23477/m.23140 type:complete len:82 (+) Transcript_23477:432-677(+)